MFISNFKILDNKWPELYKLGNEAENYAFSDPQSALMKLRCFIEMLVNTIYRDLDLYTDDKWDLYCKLKNDNFSKLISKPIMQKFHAIRINANKAVHVNQVISSDDSIWLIEEAYYIACWVYRSYHQDIEISFNEFNTPIDNGNRADLLNLTILELEETLELEKQKNSQLVNDNSNNFDITNSFRNRNNEAAVKMNINNEEINKRMSLLDIFTDYNLTKSQNETINKLDKFLNDKEQNVFLLKGYAGTGKTFLTKGLTEYLTSLNIPYSLAAPTGKAAKVISEKTNSEAYTIHKTIYSYKDLKEYKVENVDGTETFKFYFNLNNNGVHSSNQVYIIDEASMISDSYQEGEFFRFGSGKLLSDLLEYIKLDHNDHNKKIILIGDSAQLPPVGMNSSPALDSVYLKEHFSLMTTISELTDVVRQEQNSGILQNSTNLRNSIQKNIFNKIDINLDFEDIMHVDHENLLSEYLESCNYRINSESIVIAYSNSVVDDYNSIIRDHFFPNQEYLVPGDKVMAVSNNSNQPIFIYNGDFGLVRNVNSEIIRREVFVREKINEELITTKVPLCFRKVEIGFKNSEDGKSYFFETLVFENILYRNKIYKGTEFDNNIAKFNLKDREISRFETVALYVDFVERAKKRGLKPNTEEFKQTIKKDEFFNSLKIKFGYAITCHKAQGSEWNNVFVNCKTHQNTLSKDYFRWIYTAITRASKKLYVMDEPHISYTKVDSGNDESKSTISDSVIDYISEIVNKICKNKNTEIIDVKHHSYCELYTFSQGEKSDRIQIFYDGKNKIKNIRSIENNNLPELYDEINKKLHDTVVYMTKDINESFVFPQTFLEDFYSNIHSELKSSNIKIIDIKHINYCEVYTFELDLEVAIINFWYNGKNQFKKAPQHQNGSSIELVNKIYELL